MNKTKVIATAGPSCYKKETLEELVSSGVDVIRLNMSYSDYSFCEHIIENIDEINDKLGTTVSIMIDLEGPCIRISEFSDGSAEFKTGDRIRMYMKSMIGDNVQFSVNYPRLIDDLKFHSVIILSKGKVKLEVVEKGLDYVVLEVIHGGVVDSLSRVYLPGIKIKRKFLTKQDKEDILFANKMNVDFISVSNIFDVEDILEVNDMLIELANPHIALLAKIQNKVAVEELDKIIEIADGIILSRSDLAVEMPLENVPNIKHQVIRKCHYNGKVSIITAELDSFLTKEILPNRSEVSDLSSAASESVDAILLGGETAIGMHPAAVINELERIINASEKTIDYEYFFNKALETETKNIAGTIASSVVLGAIELKCKGIITITNSGYTAKQVSRLRPSCIIVAVTPNSKIAKRLNLHFGVVPVVIDDLDFDDLSARAVIKTKKLLYLKSGDKVIITGGYPFKEVKHTNFMKIEEIE